MCERLPSRLLSARNLLSALNQKYEVDQAHEYFFYYHKAHEARRKVTNHIWPNIGLKLFLEMENALYHELAARRSILK